MASNDPHFIVQTENFFPFLLLSKLLWSFLSSNLLSWCFPEYLSHHLRSYPYINRNKCWFELRACVGWLTFYFAHSATHTSPPNAINWWQPVRPCDFFFVGLVLTHFHLSTEEKFRFHSVVCWRFVFSSIHHQLVTYVYVSASSFSLGLVKIFGFFSSVGGGVSVQVQMFIVVEWNRKRAKFLLTQKTKRAIKLYR